MIKACYFCNTPDTSLSSLVNIICPACPFKHNLSDVITTYKLDAFLNVVDILYAHIYWSGYHIRLHLKENYTVIFNANILSFHQEALRLPGFPINPSNIKEKLKLYLVFS